MQKNTTKNNNDIPSIKVFDFFSGCGGTSEGLRQAGMDIAVGIDNDKDSAKTFKHNFSKHCPDVDFINEDIREIKLEEIKNRVEDFRKDGNLILFCGCAPCQPFSSQNKKRFADDDKRISLLSEFGRFVEECKPDFIFCENVPGMQKLKDTNGPLPKFTSLLEKELGYYVTSPKVVQAEKYGVPQRRKRLIIIASKFGVINFPEETHGENKLPYVTVRDTLKELPSINAGEEHKNKNKYPNHKSAGLNDLNLKRIKSITEGQGRKDWPKKYMLDCHKKHNGHSDVYGRLEWDKPSVTLTTKCTNISNGRFGHPEQHRAISVREAALLQSFPMDFEFIGSGLGSMARQVGNAVPVQLAKIFGKTFIEHAKMHLEAKKNG